MYIHHVTYLCLRMDVCISCNFNLHISIELFLYLQLTMIYDSDFDKKIRSYRKNVNAYVTSLYSNNIKLENLNRSHVRSTNFCNLLFSQFISCLYLHLQDLSKDNFFDIFCYYHWYKMKILSWNDRGAKGFNYHLKHLINTNKPHIIILMETKIHTTSAQKTY